MSDDFDRTGQMYSCRMRFTARRDDFRHIYHKRKDGGFWSHAVDVKCEECEREEDSR